MKGKSTGKRASERVHARTHTHVPRLPVTAERERVVLAPTGPLGLVVVTVTLAETTVLLAGSGQTTSLAALVNRVADPVDTGITTDRLVRRVDEDHLKVLVHAVLVDPVRVEHTKTTAAASDTLLGSRTQRTLELELVHTLVRGLAERGTLVNGLLAVTTANTDTVDDVSLLGLHIGRTQEHRKSAGRST